MQVLSPKHALVAEINMIPLIDVALILLIIFMVITPFLVQSQIAVKLPKSDQGSPSPQSSLIQILIASDGSVSLGGRRIGWQNLERELMLKLSRASRKTVLVQADKSVPIEKVVFVLDVAKKLGVGKLGIGVAPHAS